MRITYNPEEGWNVDLEFEFNDDLLYPLLVLIPTLCTGLAFVTWVIGQVFK